ncbi:MAG: cslB, partial [Armatimonadetes bacterium]|nr:cslB [Armatimonadota bacterium]
MGKLVILGLTCALAAGVVGLPRDLGAAETAVKSATELKQAIGSARPGDTIVLADGSYPDLQIQLRGSGEEQRPITLRAATPGKVVLTGTSSLEMRGAWLVVEGLRFDRTTVTPITIRESQHCRVTGCAIVRSNPPDQSRLHWIRIAGPTSLANRIDHCYTEGKLTDGVVLTVEGDDGKMPLDTRIDNNHFREVVRAVNNGMETIRVGTSQFGQLDSRTVVESNLFEGCSGDAEIISSKSCGNTYRWNTFRDCDGAVTMRHGHRSLI